jgi:hypothetical protein
MSLSVVKIRETVKMPFGPPGFERLMGPWRGKVRSWI